MICAKMIWGSYKIHEDFKRSICNNGINTCYITIPKSTNCIILVTEKLYCALVTYRKYFAIEWTRFLYCQLLIKSMISYPILTQIKPTGPKYHLSSQKIKTGQKEFTTGRLLAQRYIVTKLTVTKSSQNWPLTIWLLHFIYWLSRNGTSRTWKFFLSS